MKRAKHTKQEANTKMGWMSFQDSKIIKEVKPYATSLDQERNKSEQVE
jgi:hypothetical protein